MLNKQEYKYFCLISNKIKQILGMQVPIHPLNHRIHTPTDEGEILGCCHKIRDDSNQIIGYVITIDEDYIKSCYYGRQTQYSEYSDFALIETICHEIAHLYYWNHDKKSRTTYQRTVQIYKK